jgi:putative ABC transport system permease protein
MPLTRRQITMRQAIRSLRKSPVLAGIAVASLALGIGANLTVYAVVRELVLNDVSAHRLDRLVRLGPQINYPIYRELRPDPTLEAFAFNTGIHDTNWQNGDHAEIAWGMDTSPNFFDVLGIRPLIGRVYSQADEGRLLAVVTHGFWTRRLHTDHNVVGRALQLNQRVYTIVGVLPSDYRSVMRHSVSPEIYAPARVNPSTDCRTFARMREGVTRAQALAAWNVAFERFEGPGASGREASIRALGGMEANAEGEGDDRRFFVFFAMLFGVSGVLVLIACSNVANLLLARGVNRRREMAIRKALGASRLQMARPILTEGIILVGCGCAVALAIDAFLRDWLSAVRWPNAYNVPVEFHFQSDRGLILYTLLIAFTALVISSLQPVLRGSKADLVMPLKRAGAGVAVGRPRNGFGPASYVGMQVVLSVLLLTLGAIFARSFLQIVREDLGFDAAHTVITAVHPYPRQGERGPWRDRLIRRIMQVPGVAGVTSTQILPLMGEVDRAEVRGENDPSSAMLDVYWMGEGEQYFTTLGIRILRGRDFELRDRDRKPTPAIVNSTLARQLFGERDPIGARLFRGRERAEALVIVGLVADSKMRTLGEGSKPALYTPDFNGQLVTRVTGAPGRWIEPLRRAVSEADPTAAQDIRPMKDAVEGALLPMRVAAGLVGGLSLLGLVLALVGLYGSVSYAVGRRTREMGIRAALGATRVAILSTALRDATAVVAVAISAGLVSALMAIRPLVDLLPAGLDPWDPRMFAGIAAIVMVTCATAALVPGRRAAAVDPSVALREE